MKYNKSNKFLYLKLANCIRVLTADAVERANSGHPGMPLGMADVMTILAFHFLKFNPKDPKWFNRDRLVLSNGHGSMLLYAFYYLTDYSDFSLEDIKNFRKIYSKTAGHPEYNLYKAIETTTGPLGQGLASSIGMAIAQKKYAEKLGQDVCNYKIYCIVGDGCLMEGISYEAISLAGHLRLNNLIVLFDDNQITIDGRTDLTVSEDHKAKFKAMGWKTYTVDGHDPIEIYNGLKKAQNSQLPVFISCKTFIAKGCKNKVNTEIAHGSPLGKDEIKLLKDELIFKDEDFFIPSELLKLWRLAGEKHKNKYKKWKKLNKDTQKFNINKEDFFKLEQALEESNIITDNSEATRTSSGRIIYELIQKTNQIICGSSDLSISNNIKNNLSKAITKDDFSGNFIHYGVREHSMAAIMNGLALSGFFPIGGTFLVFSDYMKAGIRMSAIMGQKVIYIMTHDSIGLGEDGPTHQPVEQLAALRAMPNMVVFRPADMVETLECYRAALLQDGPVVFALTRQNVTQIRKIENDNLSIRGAYIIKDCIDASINYHNIIEIDICIWATGSEVQLALEVYKILTESSDLNIRVISIPSFELFFKQDEDYIKTVKGAPKINVAIEAACSFGWHRIIGIDGVFFGVEEFGISAHYTDIYEHFGLTPKNISLKIKQMIKNK